MNSDVSEENVQQLRVFPIQNRANRLHFGCGELPWFVANLPKPKASEKMAAGFLDQIDFVERKFSGMLPLLRDNDRPNPMQAGDLPIDVQHLRLQKRRAIKRDNRS